MVTGAARGIGEAIALRLARMGAAVVLTARDSARLAQVKAAIEEHGGKAMVLPCDLTDARAVAALGERVARSSAAATSWSTMPASLCCANR